MFVAIRDGKVEATAHSISALKDAVSDALGDDAVVGTFTVAQLRDESFRFERRLVCVHNLDE